MCTYSGPPILRNTLETNLQIKDAATQVGLPFYFFSGFIERKFGPIMLPINLQFVIFSFKRLFHTFLFNLTFLMAARISLLVFELSGNPGRVSIVTHPYQRGSLYSLHARGAWCKEGKKNVTHFCGHSRTTKQKEEEIRCAPSQARRCAKSL